MGSCPDTDIDPDCYYFEGVYHYPTPDCHNHFIKKAAETAKENYTKASPDGDRTEKHVTKVELNIDSRFRFYQKSDMGNVKSRISNQITICVAWH